MFPLPSLAEQLSSVVPSGKVLPDGGTQVTGPTEPQLSVADVVNVATAPEAFVHITLTLTGQVSTGGVLSTTVTVAVQSSDRPPGSVQVSVTLVFPSANGPAATAHT